MFKNQTTKFRKKKQLAQSPTYLDGKSKENCSKEENLLFSASFLNTPITRTEMAVHNLLQNYAEITDPEIRESLQKEISKNPFRVITRQMINVPAKNEKEAIETSVSMVKLRNSVNNELPEVSNPIIKEIKIMSGFRNTSRNRINLNRRSRNKVVSKSGKCYSKNEKVTRRRPEIKRKTKYYSRSNKSTKIHLDSKTNTRLRSTSKRRRPRTTTYTRRRSRTVTNTKRGSKYERNTRSHSKSVRRHSKYKRVGVSLPRRKKRERSSFLRRGVFYARSKRKASASQPRDRKNPKSILKRKMIFRNKSEARKTSNRHLKCVVDEKNVPLKRRKMQGTRVFHNKKATEGCNSELGNLSPNKSGKDVIYDLIGANSFISEGNLKTQQQI